MLLPPSLPATLLAPPSDIVESVRESSESEAPPSEPALESDDDAESVRATDDTEPVRSRQSVRTSLGDAGDGPRASAFAARRRWCSRSARMRELFPTPRSPTKSTRARLSVAPAATTSSRLGARSIASKWQEMFRRLENCARASWRERKGTSPGATLRHTPMTSKRHASHTTTTPTNPEERLRHASATATRTAAGAEREFLVFARAAAK